MNYHVNRNGQALGVFNLDDLVLRRRTGELTGGEMTWCEGMAGWELLDAVLRRDAPQSFQSAPPPMPMPMPSRPREGGSNTTKIVLWIVGVCVALFIAMAVVAGIFVVRVAKKARESVLANMQNSTKGVELASRPLQTTTNSLTEMDVARQHEDFRRRLWVDGYKKFSRHDKPWDADAARLMVAWVENDGRLHTNRTDVRVLSEKLMAANCDDPLVLVVAGFNVADAPESIRRLARAAEEFGKSKHHAYLKFYGAVLLADKTLGEAGRSEQSDTAALLLWSEVLGDGSVQPQDHEELAKVFTGGWAGEFFKRNGSNVCHAVKAAGKNYEWLALVLDGELHINEAWKVRGGGYANTVTTRGWDGFGHHLSLAETSLTAAWKLRPDLATAAHRMMTVALGKSEPEQIRAWFDRVVGIQVDHPGAWSSMRWGLRPRWFGSHDAMLALGKMAVDTGRFDTDVPYEYFRVLEDIERESELSVGDHSYFSEETWPDLSRMYEGYIAEPSKSSSQSGWRSAFAAAAVIAGEYEVARRQLEALDWKLEPEQLRRWGVDFSMMPLEVAARTGGCGTLVVEAEGNRSMEEFDDALKTYAKVIVSKLADDRTRAFATMQSDLIRFEQQYAKGEWMRFMPSSETDPGWVFAWGRPVRVDKDLLEIESRREGHLLYSRARVGQDFELRGEFDVVNTSSGDFEAGIVMGVPDTRPENKANFWHGLRVKHEREDRDFAVLSKGWTTLRVSKKTKLNPDKNSFLFRLADGKASATVNGEESMSKVALPGKLQFDDNNFYAGLGSINGTNSSTIIRYRNVQIRRLESAMSQGK